MDDKEIINIFKNSKGNITSSKATNRWLIKHLNIKEYLEHRYDPEPFISYGYVLKCIFKGLTELPKCKNCGKILGLCFEDIRKTFCSQKCANSSQDTINKRFNTCKLRYNDPHYHNIEKSKQTRKEKYNDENYTNREKAKQTKLERYNDPNYNNPEKNKQTCLERYKVEHYSQTIEFKDRLKITKFINHGDANYINIEKREQTCLNKYNKKSYFETESFKEKSKKTCLEKYNVDHYSKSNEFKEKIHEINENKTPEQKETAIKKHIETNIKKYNAEWHTQTKEYHQKKYKRYFYDNIYFYSQDELAFYIFYKDKNYIINTEAISLDYLFKNKSYKYFPDFEIEGKLYEIKGKQFLDKETGKWRNPFRDPNWTDAEYKESCDKYEAKHQCALQNGVEIIYDCEKYKRYVENTYGKDFIKSCIHA